jgi:hypothetical protein
MVKLNLKMQGLLDELVRDMGAAVIVTPELEKEIRFLYESVYDNGYRDGANATIQEIVEMGHVKVH